MDKNSDGAVTAQEFAAAHGEQMAARAAHNAPMRGAATAPGVADFDQNADGKMTRPSSTPGATPPPAPTLAALALVAA